MFSIKQDSVKNRVYVTINDSLKLEEIQQYTDSFKAAVDKCKSGFTVCVDNTNASLNTQEVNEKLLVSRDYAMLKGLRNSAMVVNSATFKMQMKRIFKELGNIFQSVAEADKFLDSAPDIKSQMK